MGLDRPIDTTTDQRKTVLALLASHLPNTTAWVYGSRVKWTSSPKSDLDLVVFAAPEQTGQVSNLREAFEESNLPFRVDLFVWDEVPEQFRKQIEAEHVVLAERGGLGVPGGWHRSTLDQLGRIVTGKTPPSKIQGSFGGDIPFVTPTDLDGRRVIVSTGRSLTRRGIEAVYNSRIPARSVMVSCIGSDMGKTAIAARECVTNQQINSIVVDSTDEPLFVYYNLSNRKAEIRASAGGSAQPILNKSGFGQFDILLPPLPEQRAIAHILGTLDDKIELNRRMNQTLEEMARALFKSWFVDFDPVRAKATLKHHAATLPQRGSDWTVERARAYLDRIDPSIAALFPDSFVGSELGPIPAGWEVARLAEMIEVNPLRPLRRGEIAPYLDMANMPTKGHTPETVIDRPFGSGMRFTNGDTLLARITPCLENGKTAYVDFLKEDQIGWGSTEYIVLHPKSPLPSEFTYCLARSAGFRGFAIQNMTGTSGRQRVPATAISNYRMTVPNGLGVPQIFGELVKPLFLLASQNADESRALATLRDTLLPKLISGEVRIKAIASLGRVAQLAR